MNFDYNRRGQSIEIIIRGEFNEKLDTFKWNTQDKKLEKKIFNVIKNKYGIFNPEQNTDDSDLNWLIKKG